VVEQCNENREKNANGCGLYPFGEIGWTKESSNARVEKLNNTLEA